MRAPRRWVVCGALLVSMGTHRPAYAEDDAWFSADKGLHFGASAAIAGGTYGVSARHFDSRVAPLLIGAGVGVLAGATKEVWDASGYGTPSWKDVVWDVLGVATGLLIAWGIDVLVRGKVSARTRSSVTVPTSTPVPNR